MTSRPVVVATLATLVLLVAALVAGRLTWSNAASATAASSNLRRDSSTTRKLKQQFITNGSVLGSNLSTGYSSAIGNLNTLDGTGDVSVTGRFGGNSNGFGSSTSPQGFAAGDTFGGANGIAQGTIGPPVNAGVANFDSAATGMGAGNFGGQFGPLMFGGIGTGNGLVDSTANAVGDGTIAPGSLAGANSFGNGQGVGGIAQVGSAGGRGFGASSGMATGGGSSLGAGSFVGEGMASAQFANTGSGYIGGPAFRPSSSLGFGGRPRPP